MKVQPIDKFGYQIFPITGNTIEITEEQARGIINRTHCFNENLTAVIEYTPTTEELMRKQKQETQTRIAELKNFLRKTDYQAIKYAEGQLTEAEYAEMKAQRQQWRDEINQIEEELGIQKSVE